MKTRTMMDEKGNRILVDRKQLMLAKLSPLLDKIEKKDKKLAHAISKCAMKFTTKRLTGLVGFARESVRILGVTR